MKRNAEIGHFAEASRKRNQKKTPVSRAFQVRLHIAAPDGRAETHPAYSRAQTVAASISSGTSIRRPRDKGVKPQTTKSASKPVSEGNYLSRSFCGKKRISKVLLKTQIDQNQNGDLSQAIDCVRRQGRSPSGAAGVVLPHRGRTMRRERRRGAQDAGCGTSLPGN